MTFSLPHFGRNTEPHLPRRVAVAEQARAALLSASEAMLEGEPILLSERKLGRYATRLNKSDLPPFEILHTSVQTLANLFASGHPDQALIDQLRATIDQVAPLVYPQDTSSPATNQRNKAELETMLMAVLYTNQQTPFPSAHEEARIVNGQMPTDKVIDTTERMAEEIRVHGDLSRLEQEAVPYDPFANDSDD